MLELLNWAYGPAGQTDPYYLLLRDFVLLMPWWYPWFWVAIIVSVLAFRFLRRWRRAHVSRRGSRRVQARTERLLDKEAAKFAARRMRRSPANDRDLAGQTSTA
jgi:hypothetical protein